MSKFSRDAATDDARAMTIPRPFFSKTAELIMIQRTLVIMTVFVTKDLAVKSN